MSNGGPKRKRDDQAGQHEHDPTAPPISDLPPLHPDDSINSTVPSIARVHDYLLYGKDNYPADRELAEKLLQAMPRIRDMTLANRYFLVRAVRYLAGEAGIAQFIDLGMGLPAPQNVHQAAREVNPETRTLYVDHDSLVVTHGQALLADNGNTRVIQADMREPKTILDHPDTRRLIDFTESVAVSFGNVLHFLAEDDDPYGVVGGFREVMAPGSCLVVSHWEDRHDTKAAVELYQEAMQRGTLRSGLEIERFFVGFELVKPGLVPLPEWRPELRVPLNMLDMPFLGGVGCKPS